jgi:hypothetical protein
MMLTDLPARNLSIQLSLLCISEGIVSIYVMTACHRSDLMSQMHVTRVRVGFTKRQAKNTFRRANPGNIVNPMVQSIFQVSSCNTKSQRSRCWLCVVVWCSFGSPKSQIVIQPNHQVHHSRIQPARFVGSNTSPYPVHK